MSNGNFYERNYEFKHNYVCPSCGAIVADTDKHSDWHVANDKE